MTFPRMYNFHLRRFYIEYVMQKYLYNFKDVRTSYSFIYICLETTVAWRLRDEY